jgi:cytochrome c551/c552
MKKLTCLVIAFAAACGGGDEGAGTETSTDMIAVEATFSSIHANVLKRRCTAGACHDASSPSAGLSFVTAEAAYAGLVGKPAEIAPAKTLVAPGDPGASFLIAKLRGELAEGEGDPMPYKSSMLSETTVAKIEAWIAAGAPNE